MKKIFMYLDEAQDTGIVKNDADLAKRLGISRASVSEWRSGKSTPNDDQAVKLAVLLGKDAGEILAECGAARAKSPETRRAWERIAAKMAASSITVCVLIIGMGQSQEAQARQVNKLLFSELQKRRLIKRLSKHLCDMTECIAIFTQHAISHNRVKNDRAYRLAR